MVERVFNRMKHHRKASTRYDTIAVYFGAAGIVKTRYAVPAALCADLAGFMAAAWAVRVIFY